ncbi:MAG: tetratricopeptide repeat protein, partial [Planctomycetota bacterium]|nr:tetratricopeptide repeat protein [Planctomycetota bacterium]
WIPLTWLSLMLDFQFGGLSPVPFHVTNLLFHLANTLLLFAFLRRATGDLWRPALAAALFALHPLRVESVAWVTERKDVLSAFFALLALFVYVGDGFGHVVGGRDKHWPRLALVGLLMVLSLWAKPMLITLPCVLLLLDAWPLRRAGLPTSAPDGWTFGEPNPPWWAWRWRPYLEKLPLLAVSLAFAVVALLTQTNTGAVRTDGTYTPAARLANALVSYCRYLGKHFWFGNLAVPYPYPPAWPATIVIGAAALLLAITLAALLLYRPRPFLAVGWFWFLGTLLPVIGVIQSGDQSMADRFTYFPSIGLCIAAAWLLPNRLGATALARRVTAAAAATVLVALAVFTYRQVDHWRNSEALFTRAVTVTAGNCFAHDALAKVLDGKGDHAGAFKHFRESININPNFFDPHFNLGVALMRANNHREAAEQFDIASQLRPTSVDAHGNFGLALANLNQFDRAIRQYQQAISLSPPGAASPRLHGNLANALLLRGDPARAIEHYRIALAAQPDNADLRGRLGLALASIGRFDDALRELATALAKKPDDPVLRQMLDRVREAKRQSGGP